MCGIVGYTGPREAGPILIEGLRRLEYRGYDSAGIALVDDAGDLFVEKQAGKLANLQTAHRRPHAARRDRPRPHALGDPRPPERPQRPSAPGLHRARSRSSTTGSSRTSGELRDGLEARGHTLDVRDRHRGARPPRRGGLRRRPRRRGPRGARARSQGAYAIAVMHRGEADRLVGARQDVPLVVGLGEGETFLACDVAAILAHTRPGHLPRGRRRRGPAARRRDDHRHRRRRRASGS